LHSLIGDTWKLRAAAQQINIQKSNRLVTQAALDRAGDTKGEWWSDAVLSQCEGLPRQFFLEAQQTLPVLVTIRERANLIDAMKVHRIRLSEPPGNRGG
jgi:hypothetical protein